MRSIMSLFFPLLPQPRYRSATPVVFRSERNSLFNYNLLSASPLSVNDCLIPEKVCFTLKGNSYIQ